jgi:hypothetical protein
MNKSGPVPHKYLASSIITSPREDSNNGVSGSGGANNNSQITGKSVKGLYASSNPQNFIENLKKKMNNRSIAGTTVINNSASKKLALEEQA